MTKIIDFREKVVGKHLSDMSKADDYYIVIPELSELSEHSEKRILKDIEKGILKADKINGDLLIPMDMAEEYIKNALDKKLMFVKTSAIVLGMVMLVIAGMAAYIAFS